MTGIRRNGSILLISTTTRALLVTVFVAAASACSPTVSQRGNLPDPVTLEKILPGEATRRDVARTLGSPSSVATFGDEVWYYISSRVERFAFYSPKVTEQQIVAIAFDDTGTVRSIERYGLEDARKIDPVARTTPTSGKTLTILQQLVGNVGRFVRKDDTSTP
ncbi:MAG: outer membrane protein assembly factor BamE [Alphaproteobacteria bacterium]